ncbi:LysE family translocator [Propylenella binzhouense]|uniref:LysE family translocator n=1 Tax=Propylenella binzhouense TaxID=2555902 RepID=A0A964T7U2_9HYPH|nr:LysE family translocator [Propylenella binzhouense]MYZ49660.1 LysE family translocator [Propylenella binzhouense]
MLNAYLLALGGLFLAQIAPGPNLMAVAGAALGQGRRIAFFVALGIASAILVWMSLATFGLAALLAIHPGLLTAMKLLGGGYLCFVALRAFRAAWIGLPPRLGAERATWTRAQAWRRGILVNLTNPKSALAWTALATFLYGSGLSAPAVLAFAPLGCLSALIVYGSYGTLFSSGLAKRAYARFARAIEALFGLAFGAIGAELLADGIGEVATR